MASGAEGRDGTKTPWDGIIDLIKSWPLSFADNAHHVPETLPDALNPDVWQQQPSGHATITHGQKGEWIEGIIPSAVQWDARSPDDIWMGLGDPKREYGRQRGLQSTTTAVTLPLGGTYSPPYSHGKIFAGNSSAKPYRTPSNLLSSCSQLPFSTGSRFRDEESCVWFKR